MRARIAGALYFVSVLAAIANEALVHGRLLYIVSLVPIACFFAATLLLYAIFRSVNAVLAALAAASNVVSLAFEAIEVHPGGYNVALAFHGLSCLLLGILAFRSRFVPIILGVLMMAAGLAWIAKLSPVSDQLFSPYAVAIGFVGEGALMLWLLVFGEHGRLRQSER